MKVAFIIAALTLAACGDASNVTETHIRAAGQACQNNGGIKGIREARQQDRIESESCGYRCVKFNSTGQVLYSANVECNNGAHFNLNFVE